MLEDLSLVCNPCSGHDILDGVMLVCDPCSGHISTENDIRMMLVTVPMRRLVYGDALGGHVGLDGPLGW